MIQEWPLRRSWPPSDLMARFPSVLRRAWIDNVSGLTFMDNGKGPEDPKTAILCYDPHTETTRLNSSSLYRLLSS